MNGRSVRTLAAGTVSSMPTQQASKPIIDSMPAKNRITKPHSSRLRRLPRASPMLRRSAPRTVSPSRAMAWGPKAALSCHQR